MSVELAITLDQPYPALIVAGVKDWETRPSPPNGPMRPDGVRGLPGCAVHPGERIAIHAAAKQPKVGATIGEWTVEDTSYTGHGESLISIGHDRPDMPGARLCWPLEFGAVVATAVVAEVAPIVAGPAHPGHDAWISVMVHTRDTRLHLRRLTVTGITGEAISDQLPCGDWRPGRWAWRLTDVRPVDPIPCRGAQGVWRLPRRVQEALCDA